MLDAWAAPGFRLPAREFTVPSCCASNLHQPPQPIASLLVGLAAADAIQKTTNLLCDLRWPNDVLIGERKVAGILTHLINDCVIAGIGINVNQLGFPSDLRTPATSLRMESNGREQSREPLIIQLLESLEIFCEKLGAKASKEFCSPFPPPPATRAIAE